MSQIVRIECITFSIMTILFKIQIKFNGVDQNDLKYISTDCISKILLILKTQILTFNLDLLISNTLYDIKIYTLSLLFL